MPKLIIDYSRTIIYKLVCKDTKIKDCYVGATTNFIKRKYRHKTNCNNKNIKVYQYIRNNGGWNNWDMIMVEEYPCKNKLESDMRERYWLETLEAKLNIQLPTRTNKECKNDNKIKIKEQNAIWYIVNKERIDEYNKEKYKNNKDEITQKILCNCGCYYTKNNYTNHKKTKKHINSIQVV
jgi:hypothetical protein